MNCALHAADAEPLDAPRLACVAPEDQGSIRLIANPSIALVQLGYPADTIWRAVLAGDDDALQKIDLDCGPVHVLVERRTRGVDVERLDVRPWEFLAVLCAGEPIETAIESSDGFDCSSALAEHLALGRFRCFELAPDVGDRVTSTTIPR